VHMRSAQRDMPFVKVNCAAIPETLLESELFGHVKGAFTNAVATKRGKFALAHRGSIFLDEIGTMPRALQAKLLRVLQEREIEPLGGERSQAIDVRVIAATNRDLRELVEQGQFQSDLFYRLHVVPIAMPALRDRLEDIPLLVDHLVRKHATRQDRTIEGVDEDVIDMLRAYHWPGNNRELENNVERALAMTTGAHIARDAIVCSASSVLTQATVPTLKLQQNVEWAEQETIRRAVAVL